MFYWRQYSLVGHVLHKGLMSNDKSHEPSLESQDLESSWEMYRASFIYYFGLPFQYFDIMSSYIFCQHILDYLSVVDIIEFVVINEYFLSYSDISLFVKNSFLAYVTYHPLADVLILKV